MCESDSLQTPGSGFVSRRQELRKVTVGIRLVGKAAESGLHDPPEKDIKHSFQSRCLLGEGTQQTSNRSPVNKHLSCLDYDLIVIGTC